LDRKRAEDVERSAIVVLLLLIVIFAAAVFMAKALIGGKKLRTEPAGHAEVAGNYTLILFGGSHGNDLETVAFLDKEDDRYLFEPYAPAFKFRTKTGVSAQLAMEKARDFVKLHPSFYQQQIRRILDDHGVAVGYEIRPLYHPEAFGAPDVLDINYVLKGDKISVFVHLTPAAEKIQNQQGG
jgi:hypothetical protein